MNNVFFDISLDKAQVQRVCNDTMIMNTKKKITNESITDDLIQYIKLAPANVGYTDNMRASLDKTRTAINKFNTKCIDKYKDATEKINPIGLEVPKVDVSDDEEIRDQYKSLRVVVLDKFQECSNEGGEGWIKFIDTLATPSERVENYKIPQFDNVYTRFLKDKKVDKVTRPDLLKSIKTICDYDKQMGQIIADADDYCDNIAKSRCVYHSKGPAFTYTESTEYLAECMLIIEKDFLCAQELEVRSKALLENVKNAHRVLFGLCTHNPRDIRESSLMRDSYISMIESQIDDISVDPDTYIHSDDKDMHEAAIDKTMSIYESKIVKTNKEFLDKYKDTALKSNCVGLNMKSWAVAIDIDKPIKQSIAIILSVLDSKKLESHDIDHLSALYESAKNMEHVINGGELSKYKDKITSPAMKKAVNILPWVQSGTEDKWYFRMEKNHTITKADVKDAVSFLKDTGSDLDILKKKAHDDTIRSAQAGTVKSLPSTKISKKERLINNLRKLTERVVSYLNSARSSAMFAQVKTIQTQSRKVITLAARVVKESTIAEEKDKAQELIECWSNLEETINTIINNPPTEEE